MSGPDDYQGRTDDLLALHRGEPAFRFPTMEAFRREAEEILRARLEAGPVELRAGAICSNIPPSGAHAVYFPEDVPESALEGAMTDAGMVPTLTGWLCRDCALEANLARWGGA